jgi:hypothetical protein
LQRGAPPPFDFLRAKSFLLGRSIDSVGGCKIMNLITMMMAFAPWIVFGLLAGNSLSSVKMAIVIALAATIFVGYKDLRAGSILTWATLGFFIFSLITVVFMTNMWVLERLNVLVYLILASVTWIGIVIGRPFVLDYARQEVDKSRWQDPKFLRVVRDMTIFWGITFLVDLGIAIYQMTNQGLLLKSAQYLVMLIAIVFTVYYPSWVRRSRGAHALNEQTE